MLADFYIPWLANDMKIAVQKNHLGGHCRSLDPSKNDSTRSLLPSQIINFPKKKHIKLTAY